MTVSGKALAFSQEQAMQNVHAHVLASEERGLGLICALFVARTAAWYYGTIEEGGSAQKNVEAVDQAFHKMLQGRGTKRSWLSAIPSLAKKLTKPLIGKAGIEGVVCTMIRDAQPEIEDGVEKRNAAQVATTLVTAFVKEHFKIGSVTDLAKMLNKGSKPKKKLEGDKKPRASTSPIENIEAAFDAEPSKVVSIGEERIVSFLKRGGGDLTKAFKALVEQCPSLDTFSEWVKILQARGAEMEAQAIEAKDKGKGKKEQKAA